MHLFPCPADIRRGEDPENPGERTCGENFPTENGAVMHAVNSGDDHENVPDKPTAYKNLVEYRVAPEAGGGEDEVERSDAGADSDKVEPLPEVPEADSGGDRETVECPNCGDGLGMTEEEVVEYREKHGAAFCEACGFDVKEEDDD